MKPLQSQINLKAVNNTSLPQKVDILGIINNQNASNNLNVLYEYDLSGYVLTSTLQLSYYVLPDVLNPIIQNINVQATIQGYVIGLNSLGLGFFQYNGNTIYVSSNTIKFSKLTF